MSVYVLVIQVVLKHKGEVGATGLVVVLKMFWISTKKEKQNVFKIARTFPTCLPSFTLLLMNQLVLKIAKEKNRYSH